jgi:ATP-dependent Clp protease ATP-binding subunit ClpB
MSAPQPIANIGDDWFRLRREQLRNLGTHLREHIKGQAHVIGCVESVLLRGELGLAHPGRPRGSFLFVGATGRGRTKGWAGTRIWGKSQRK